jgi:cobalt-precorrin 5A hydrolase
VSDPVVVALTPNGLALAGRLTRALGRGEIVSLECPARSTLEELFRARRPLVCVMALGIVVRILGPLASDKFCDTPVVVVDETGRFAISVLSGHVGGANALAQEVAAALGAVPVITTASDVLGLPAVDLIGRPWGWKIEHAENLTRVAGAVVRGEAIGVWQQAGRADWWAPFGLSPPAFLECEAFQARHDFAGLLAISDLRLEVAPGAATVVYRPPTLVVGVGCRRSVPVTEIEELFQQVCRDHGLAPACLGLVATVSLKKDEPGLMAFATRHEVPLVSYGVAELERIGPLPTPSVVVRAKIGIAGVAEPAAMRAAGTDKLVVPKVRGRRVTMAVARRQA